MDQWSKPISHKNGIRIPCNTENFVPIIGSRVLNSSSGSNSSTSRTLSRRRSHCSTFSSSSSSSPTVREMKTREREDRTESDLSSNCQLLLVDERSGRPDIDQAVKKKSNTQWKRTTERTGRHVVEGTGRHVVCRLWSCKLWDPGAAARTQRKFWWMMKFQNMETLARVLLTKYLYSAYPRDVRILVNTMFTLLSLKTEIARSAKGTKITRRRARDAKVEP